MLLFNIKRGVRIRLLCVSEETGLLHTGKMVKDYGYMNLKCLYFVSWADNGQGKMLIFNEKMSLTGSYSRGTIPQYLLGGWEVMEHLGCAAIFEYACHLYVYNLIWFLSDFVCQLKSDQPAFCSYHRIMPS